MKPEKEATQYELQKETASVSYGASFMRAMAWMIWIGGLVLAIASSIGSESYGYYSTRTTFNWGNFSTVIATYAVYGGLAWSVASLFEDVHGIFQVMSTLKLVEKEKPTTKTESAKKIHSSASGPSSIIFNQWKCQKCGTMNDKSRLFCKNCGAIK